MAILCLECGSADVMQAGTIMLPANGSCDEYQKALRAAEISWDDWYFCNKCRDETKVEDKVEHERLD